MLPGRKIFSKSKTRNTENPGGGADLSQRLVGICRVGKPRVFRCLVFCTGTRYSRLLYCIASALKHLLIHTEPPPIIAYEDSTYYTPTCGLRKESRGIQRVIKQVVFKRGLFWRYHNSNSIIGINSFKKITGRAFTKKLQGRAFTKIYSTGTGGKALLKLFLCKTLCTSLQQVALDECRR